ncbi:MAG: hypothetical protein DLM50_00575 [Candidatus Meridianibacter frigidus]|nr:MAG: hypothetical protein DLM50_00575 [Candidatus Eremiobacteraeota bacterium]
MNQTLFIARRGPAWDQLESLLASAGVRGVRRLQPDQVEQLGRLYRWVTSDFAYAQGHAFDPKLQAYLNRLVARAHAAVYRGSVESGRERLTHFFSRTFPQEFRRSFWYVATCIALTVCSAMLAYAIVAAHPDKAFALLPSEMVPAHIQKSLHDSNFAVKPEESAAMSALIITNNIKVSVVAFGGGMTLGILTAYIIIFNGLMLGGMGALFAHAGFGFDFWATVAPHGLIELTAIQISGAAGLLLAAAVIAPGRRHRGDALRENGRRAGTLIAGVAAMLCVAGTIEGFFSPLRFAPEIRIAVGALTGVAMLAYFSLAGTAKVTRAA